MHVTVAALCDNIQVACVLVRSQVGTAEVTGAADVASGPLSPASGRRHLSTSTPDPGGCVGFEPGPALKDDFLDRVRGGRVPSGGEVPSNPKVVEPRLPSSTWRPCEDSLLMPSLGPQKRLVRTLFFFFLILGFFLL